MSHGNRTHPCLRSAARKGARLLSTVLVLALLAACAPPMLGSLTLHVPAVSPGGIPAPTLGSVLPTATPKAVLPLPTSGVLLPPEISAPSAVVLDFESGDILYEKDADTLRVPASMTKVMTAYIIMEELEAGNLTLEDRITITSAHSALSNNAKYPAKIYLPTGSRITVDTMLKLILVPSASACCIIMAELISGSEAAFVQRMNDTAKRLGLEAEYNNAHGAQTNYITARAQALLVREAIDRFPQLLDYTGLHSVTFNGKAYMSTNALLYGNTDYDGVDGFKTGTSPDALYCLSTTATREDARVVAVVMKAENNTSRLSDSVALLDYSFSALALVD